MPCSYLTPFINYVLQDSSLHYVSVANEGDAVALIAGVTLGGEERGRRGITMMQNSGLGNAVSPLTSLTWTFRLPQLLIVTWRGQPGVADEPQHALMGPITPAMLDTMDIPWELFPTEPKRSARRSIAPIAHMDATGGPYALVMQKGSVAPYALRQERTSVIAERPPCGCSRCARRGSRCEALAAGSLAASNRAYAEPSTVVLASTGFCGRELYAIDDRPNQLYMVGSMGCVAPLALGLALARPDLRVVALDGDGAALMRMGAFATVGAYGPSNLQHVLLDNGVHDSTGGQATVSGSLVRGSPPRAATDGVRNRRYRQIDSAGGAAARRAAVCATADTSRDADLPRPTLSCRCEDAADAAYRPARSAVMLLLNPGPVTLTERVRRSLLQADLCHRESEFYDLQEEARARLLPTYQLDPAEWSAVLVTGSGTAAVESMIAALVPETGRLLVVENGVYGERMAQICAQYRIAHERISDPGCRRRILRHCSAARRRSQRSVTHVAVVHHETTTGRLNDLGHSPRCASRRVRLLVDGVSSFGAEPIEFTTRHWPPWRRPRTNVCTGCRVRRSSSRAAARSSRRRAALTISILAGSLFCRISAIRRSRRRYMPITRWSRRCASRREGGRLARYALCGAGGTGSHRPGRAGNRERPAAEQSSVVLRSYWLPAGIAYPALHDALKAAGYVIYAGQGDLSKSLFRISTMGNVSAADIERLLKCFSRLLE